MQIEQFEEAGRIDPWKIAVVLRASAEEIAMTVGLRRGAPQCRELIQSVWAQRRLREFIGVPGKAEPRLGSELMAYAWNRSQSLSGIDGRSAMQLAREGRAQQVLCCVDAVDSGVCA